MNARYFGTHEKRNPHKSSTQQKMTLFTKFNHNMPLNDQTNHKTRNVPSNAYQCIGDGASDRLRTTASYTVRIICVYSTNEIPRFVLWNIILPSCIIDPDTGTRQCQFASEIFRARYVYNDKAGFSTSKHAVDHLSISQIMPLSSECSNEQE